MNGPVSVVFVSSQLWEVEEKKAALVSYFLASNTIIIAFYLAAGLDTGHTFGNFAVCAPFLAAGSLFGAAAARKLDRNTAQKIIYLVIALMGATMLR